MLLKARASATYFPYGSYSFSYKKAIKKTKTIDFLCMITKGTPPIYITVQKYKFLMKFKRG